MRCAVISAATFDRHCADGSQIDDAELIVQEVIANSIEHAEGPVWVQLTWLPNSQSPSVRDLGPGSDFPPTRPCQPYRLNLSRPG